MLALCHAHLLPSPSYPRSRPPHRCAFRPRHHFASHRPRGEDGGTASHCEQVNPRFTSTRRRAHPPSCASSALPDVPLFLPTLLARHCARPKEADRLAVWTSARGDLLRGDARWEVMEQKRAACLLAHTPSGLLSIFPLPTLFLLICFSPCLQFVSVALLRMN
jgi:hypothetical protein